jgi:hypothetical protein
MTDHGSQNIERRLEQTILELLDRRAPTSTICPSDAARAVGGEDWRGLMDASRGSAARLVARGEVEITQGGEPVDLATARGSGDQARGRAARCIHQPDAEPLD